MSNVEFHVMCCYNNNVSKATLFIVFHIIIVTGFTVLPHTKIVASEVRAG